MTNIESYPLTVIKKLIKQKFAEARPNYEIELGSLNIDDEVLEPYENGEEILQMVKVYAHVNTPDDDDPAQCWHPWELIWNCDDSQFEGLMRADEIECIDIDVLADDVKTIHGEEDFRCLITHAEIDTVDLRQLFKISYETLKDAQFKFADGKKQRTISNVLDKIVENMNALEWADYFKDHRIVIKHINVYDSGVVVPCFGRIDDEQ